MNYPTTYESISTDPAKTPVFEGAKCLLKQGFYTLFSDCDSTGKELDEETGYGYFGARYMDHELMTGWLSVDPMSDKYPNISPYAYCAWNPVKLVDPDGNDVWNLQEDGTLVWKKASKKEQICMGDRSVFNENPIFGTYNEAGTKIDLSKATMIFGSNQSQAEMYFEFFADNLDFEFSLLGYSDKGKEKFEVTTSLNKTGDARGSARADELSSNGNLFLHAHNHPSGGYNNSTPVNHASVGNDIDFRNNIQKEGKSPNCRFYVYSKDYGGLYFDYTSSNTEKKDGVQSRFGGKKGQYYRKSLFSPLN